MLPVRHKYDPAAGRWGGRPPRALRANCKTRFSGDPPYEEYGERGARGNIRGWVGVPPQKEIFLFHSVRKNRISLAPGFPENELSNFRGFAEANFTREAYLTAGGDFTAASDARGGGSPAGDVSR